LNTTLVNINTRQPYDVYIGRQFRNYKASVFANPFKIGKNGTRNEVLMKYRSWFCERLKDASFKAEVEKLRGKRLGCWCKPEPCHGDIVIEYLDNM
jgi:hypothetical protein